MIMKSKVRKFLLEYAARSRHHPFTRVSAEALDYLEGKLRDECRKLVDAQPSKGKTIMS